MTSDDDLRNMFKHLNFASGANMNQMLRTLVRSTQLGVLKQMRRAIDEQIKTLSSEGPVGLDPYKILGVKESATREEIEKAYKSKAWTAHPDHGGKQEEFIKITAAFEAIKQVRGWR